MDRRKALALGSLAITMNRQAVEKAVKRCMGDVKKEFARLSDEKLIELLSERFGDLDQSALVFLKNPNPPFGTLVRYSGELCLKLHRPVFSARVAGLGIRCSASMHLDELSESGALKRRHTVEFGKTATRHNGG